MLDVVVQGHGAGAQLGGEATHREGVDAFGVDDADGGLGQLAPGEAGLALAGSSRVHSSIASSRAARRSRLSAWTLALVEMRSTVVVQLLRLGVELLRLRGRLARAAARRPAGRGVHGFLLAMRTAYR